MIKMRFFFKQNIPILLFAVLTVSILIAGCLGDGDSEEKEPEFGKYDSFDWPDANADAEPKSSMEMISLLMEHMEEISPGGRITALGATGATGTGLDRETGKCPAWQFYLLRYEGSQSLSMVINIAEFGWTIVSEEHEVVDIYKEWEISNVMYDSTDIISIASANSTVADWMSDHPNYSLDIQSYHGPPLGSDEESYIMIYTGGSDTLNVYIHGKVGNIIEIDDPNDWSW